MRLGVSPAAASTPTGVFNQRFEALFPSAGALGCLVCCVLPPPPGLSMRECGAIGSASGHTACPVGPTIRQSLGLAELPRVPSTLAACLCPSYWSGQIFLHLLGCCTSVRFDLMSVLVVFVFKFCSPSFGCARRRSVSTYASILVSPCFQISSIHWLPFTLLPPLVQTTFVSSIAHFSTFLPLLPCPMCFPRRGS